jgi:hypothetical protein
MTAAVTKAVLRLSLVETQLEVLSGTKEAFALYFRMGPHLPGKSISSFGSGSTSDIGPDRTGPADVLHRFREFPSEGN